MPNEKPKKKSMLGTFIIAAIAYIVLGVFMVAYPDKAAGGFRVVIGARVFLCFYGKQSEREFVGYGAVCKRPLEHFVDSF